MLEAVAKLRHWSWYCKWWQRFLFASARFTAV